MEAEFESQSPAGRGEDSVIFEIMELPPDEKKRKFDDESNNTNNTINNGLVLETNASSSSLSKEELKKLLDPLTKDQLVELLSSAGVQYGSVAEEINEVASKDPAHRKLFVRGLAWETTTVTLREAFSEYGEIEEGAVITDKTTGKSRGFGFITFKSMDAAYRALREPSKRIDGRMTVCNLAAQGSSAPVSSTADQSQRKLYVGSLSYETTSETLLNFFAQYGEIEEGAVAYDKNTNKSRGFAFVTFKTVEGAKRAVADTHKSIDARQVVVKVAAEGQREKAAQQAAASVTVQAPMMPQPQAVSPMQQTMQPNYAQTYTTAMNQQVAQIASPYRPQVASSQTVGMAYGSPAGMTAYTTAQPTYAGLTGTNQYAAPAVSGMQQQYATYTTQPYQTTQMTSPLNVSTGVGATGVTPQATGTMPMYFTGTS